MPEPTSTRADRPLAGVRVVELAGIGPGPFAAMILADLGAEITRVDRPGYENPTPGYRADLDAVGRGRRSIGVDLKSTGGREVFERLIADADVLIDPYRPGVLERLGLDPARLLVANPGLVVARLTGWGQEGPSSRQPGHDITYLATTGVLDALGPRGSRPVAPLNLVGDYAGGSLFTVIGVVSALFERARTGRGQVVDAAIVDGASLLMTLFAGYRSMGIWRDERGTNLIDGGAPFYDTYECADGGFMAVGAVEPAFYDRFVRALGLDPGSLPPQMETSAWDELRSAFAARFRTRTRHEWARAFDGSGACCEPVLSADEAHDHAHNVARRTFVSAHDTTVPAPAPRFSGSIADIAALAPPSVPGAHTRQVLLTHGYGRHEVESLLADGSVFETATRPA